MARSNGSSGTDPEPAGKQKVMVYVPPEVHRAMRQAALDHGYRSTSDVYVEAARSFLAKHDVPVEVEEEPGDGSPSEPTPSSLADLVGAVDGLASRLEEVLDRGAISGTGRAEPAGTKVAEAMRAILAALRRAGAIGLFGRELSAILREGGIRSGTEEAAKAALRGAGLVCCERRRWSLAGPEQTAEGVTDGPPMP